MDEGECQWEDCYFKVLDCFCNEKFLEVWSKVVENDVKSVKVECYEEYFFFFVYIVEFFEEGNVDGFNEEVNGQNLVDVVGVYCEFFLDCWQSWSQYCFGVYDEEWEKNDNEYCFFCIG